MATLPAEGFEKGIEFLYSESQIRKVIQGVTAMDTTALAARLAKAQEAAGLSQRALAMKAEISQPTLSRILNGQRTPKMTELLQIAEATGFTIAQLTGDDASAHVRMAARATGDTRMEAMKERLLYFVEIDSYLDDQAIPA